MRADEFQALVGQLNRLTQVRRATMARLLSEPPAAETVIALLESRTPISAAARIVAANICSGGARRTVCGAIAAPIATAPSTR